MFTIDLETGIGMDDAESFCYPSTVGEIRPIWRIDMLHQSKCDQILEHIIKSVGPIRVILFGSAAMQKSRANDLDFLVVVANGKDTRAIAHALYRNVPRLGVSLDFVVVTEEEAQESRQDFWSVVHEAETKGKELYVAKTA